MRKKIVKTRTGSKGLPAPLQPTVGYAIAMVEHPLSFEATGEDHPYDEAGVREDIGPDKNRPVMAVHSPSPFHSLPKSGKWILGVDEGKCPVLWDGTADRARPLATEILEPLKEALRKKGGCSVSLVIQATAILRSRWKLLDNFLGTTW